jgi:hypothetical protein
MPRQVVDDVRIVPTSKQQRQPAGLTAQASNQLQQTHFTHEITSQRPLQPEMALFAALRSIPRLLGVESAGM